MSLNFKERAVRFVVNNAVKLANRKINLNQMQREHEFKGRIARMNVTDLGLTWHFSLRDGQVQFLDNPTRVDGGFDLTSDAILGLVMGKRKWRQPVPPHDEYWASYTPMDAILYGEAKVWGDAASNDLLLLAKAIWFEVEPQLREELKTGLANA